MNPETCRIFAEEAARFLRELFAKHEAKQAAELAKLRRDIDALTALLAEKEKTQ